MVPPAMNYTEDWFGIDSCNALAKLTHRIAEVEGIIVEIGAWEGRSTVALAKAAWPRRVNSVDTWAGSPGEISAELAAERDVYQTWRANVDAGTDGNVNEYRMGWRDYLPTVKQPVALAFIDAEHTYTEVRDNIAALLPLMAPGGIICGDDAHHPPVQQALLELFDPHDVTLDATLWIWRKPTSDLAAEYERLCRTPSDIYLHLPRFVKLVELFNATHVVELGARSGVSTVAWLHGLEGRGRLTSVDISEAPPIGEHPHWKFIQGDDTDPAVKDKVPPCDILFVDTSHHYEHTLWELRNWCDKVRPGGLIVCHDTELQRPSDPPCPPTDPDFPVKQAIVEFCAERGWQWVNVPECWGLGIIEVGAS
jgi:predicted O-methyltransferase YrrM